jgi:hypothetical protein
MLSDVHVGSTPRTALGRVRPRLAGVAHFYPDRVVSGSPQPPLERHWNIDRPDPR